MTLWTYLNACSAVSRCRSPPISTAASPVSRIRWVSSSGVGGTFSWFTRFFPWITVIHGPRRKRPPGGIPCDAFTDPAYILGHEDKSGDHLLSASMHDVSARPRAGAPVQGQ